ncbi:hypothetical protein DMR_10560 [Solidesulfovibrio magneticus RS-1]|uniref:Uncharacterized protein n=1 Tax=Solidesulfovibrio magneticus (strain ATCC 700980 / DSM 13731 / RS-1) TaxID=573370 RepID=C4XL08_SOLM1|nr:hypothetical protein DMR_10560 [Solidesulfovibrio magneticus RS-1]
MNMSYKDLIFISNQIIGEASSTTFEKKVLLIMYFSELLVLNFTEIDILFKKHGREKIFKIFYLDKDFVEYIYAHFLNHDIDTIMPQIFDRLTKLHELLDKWITLKSCETSGYVQ